MQIQHSPYENRTDLLWNGTRNDGSHLIEESTVELNDVWTGVLAHDDIKFDEHVLLRCFVNS